jgi:hypothetical protein
LHILSAFLGKEYNLCDRLFSFELQQGRLTSITVEREYFVDSCTPWDVLESVDKAVSGAISKALSQSTHPDAKWLSDKQL